MYHLQYCCSLHERDYMPHGSICCDRPGVERWRITEDGESGVIGLERAFVFPTKTLPWQSSRGYEITDDGWVLNPTKERILWLPHHWRMGESYRTWSGRFLGFRDPELPEIVILEFFE